MKCKKVKGILDTQHKFTWQYGFMIFLSKESTPVLLEWNNTVLAWPWQLELYKHIMNLGRMLLGITFMGNLLMGKIRISDFLKIGIQQT